LSNNSDYKVQGGNKSSLAERRNKFFSFLSPEVSSFAKPPSPFKSHSKFRNQESGNLSKRQTFYP